MNERIKELAEQSGWDTHHAQFDTRIEKFAELIVQECGRVLEDNELGGYRVYYVLREHFGVEE